MAEHPMNAPHDPEAERAQAEFAAFDAGITRALETAPRFTIPAGFAARMATRAEGTKTVQSPPLASLRSYTSSLTIRHYGRNAAIVSLCILLALILLLAHRSVGKSPLWISAEAIFCLQFALLAVWLVARDLRQYFSAWNSQS